ncbi:MAG TPA: AI-2E family transporter [Solirubrobacteraceae bacterium]|nr:AI-2E family transporter [Solirubrobacteraceae bacterium]
MHAEETDEYKVSSLLQAGQAEDQSPEELIEEIHLAAAAEAGADEQRLYGEPGAPLDRRGAYFVGVRAALGVGTVALLVVIVIGAGQTLLLIGLAALIAVGLEPAVDWLMRRHLPRAAAVTVVLIVALGILGAFLGRAIPVLVNETTRLARDIPTYLHSLKNSHTFLGGLNQQFHIVTKLQHFVNTSGPSTIAGGVLGLGQVVLNLLEGIVVVTLLSIYLLADLPRVKRGLYRLAPMSRRARVVLLTEAITTRIGGYVLGNLLTSIIAGIGTFTWAAIFGIPYAFLLGVMVALLDLIPVLGSTVGGIIVSLLGLTVSVPVAVVTALFYTFYRFLEDYFLTPRIMSRTVRVPGLLTVVATLIGGALLGIIGALLAIPVAAALKLLLEETLLASLDRR